MRWETLLILGHEVIGQGQLCPPARGCHALRCLVLIVLADSRCEPRKESENYEMKNSCPHTISRLLEWQSYRLCRRGLLLQTFIGKWYTHLYRYTFNVLHSGQIRYPVVGSCIVKQLLQYLNRFAIYHCRFISHHEHNVIRDNIFCTVILCIKVPPWGRRGFKSRIRPPYPKRVVKCDYRGAVI